ncbi:MAG TPA: hypothetical protein VKK79_17755 [Candidatus Lokiarchaeia archaeon]|nr:hypothetical protein [Candidatus Lokiarchaeia archaeon]
MAGWRGPTVKFLESAVLEENFSEVALTARLLPVFPCREALLVVRRLNWPDAFFASV